MARLRKVPPYRWIMTALLFKKGEKAESACYRYQQILNVVLSVSDMKRCCDTIIHVLGFTPAQTLTRLQSASILFSHHSLATNELQHRKKHCTLLHRHFSCSTLLIMLPFVLSQMLNSVHITAVCISFLVFIQE